MKYLLLAALLFVATEIQAAPLTIVPNGTANLVTAGIPFAACALTNTNNFKLVNESGAEVPIFIKSTLMWPAAKCNGVASIRAVKIQFAYNPTQGQKVYNWSHSTRTLSPLTEKPIAEVVSTNTLKAPYKEPAFFAINDPAYLVTTGLIPPTTVAGTGDYDTTWFPAMFNKRVNQINFATTVGENWLFDSVSSIYQQALRSGKLDQYREAYLEHEFYMSKFTVTDQTTNDRDKYWIGYWGLSEGDIKYVYLTPMKLHLALTGDDTWTPSENGVPHPTVIDRDTFIRRIATRALNAQAIANPYTNVGVRFTERETGFAFQQLLAAYELTNDPALLTQLNTAVTNIHGMMTNNPDGLGNNGYLSHSWHAHEGWFPNYIGSLPAAVENTTTLTVTNIVTEDWKLLTTGTEIQGRPYGVKAILTAPPTLNSDGTITLTLDRGVTMRTGEWIATFKTGFKTDRVFSPWMQALVADGLWQFYNLSSDTAVKTKIGEVLRGFGRSIASYAIDGTGLNSTIKSQIESAFGVTVVNGPASGSRGIVPFTRYVGSYLMGGPTSNRSYLNFIMYDGGYSDQHSPESLFQLALGIKFESDTAKKAAMQSLASALSGWFSSSNLGKTILSSHPVRYFNWTNKQDPWGTYTAILANSGGSVYIPPTAPICTSYTYSAWSACSTSGTQTRTVTTSLPTSCQGGTPVLQQSCTYTPTAASDTTVPTISNGTPTGTLASTTQTATLSVNTNEIATCKFSTYATTYANMGGTMTGTTAHTASLTSLLSGRTYNYYIKCRDAAGNIAPDYRVTFTVASTTASTPTNTDTTAPVISNGLPASTLPLNSTTASLRVNTNETATCKYSSTANTAYTSMGGTFSASGGTAHTATLTGLINGRSYTYYAKCRDTALNTNTTDYTIRFSVAAPALDTIVPTRSGGSPSSALPAGTAETTLSLGTNESSICKFGTSANTAYTSMPNTFSTTGGTTHASTLTGLVSGSAYTYYAKCSDTALNANTDDYTIQFSVSAPVSSGGGGGGSSNDDDDDNDNDNDNDNDSGSSGGGGGSPRPRTPSTPTVESLLKTLAELQAKLAVLQGAQGSSQFTKDLELGMIDPQVKLLQIYLNTNGYTVATYAEGSKGMETDKFGPATKAALIRYQIAKGINPTGYFGPMTRSTMNGGGTYTPTIPVSTPTTPVTTSQFTKDLELGMIDPQVKLLQIYLNTNGYTVATYAEGSKGMETDKFGPATKAALIRFQTAKGINGTGYFGAVTRGVMQ